MEAESSAKRRLRVEVVYALPSRQSVVSLEVAPGSTVADAIALSGLQAEFPDLELDPNAVGIFGRKVTLQQELSEGDRVEIYRPLIADPKESRRRRAARG